VCLTSCVGVSRQKGFKNLYTLKGGVSNYLKEEGATKWAGNLFVFDSRLAVPPRDYDSKESSSNEVPLQADTREEVDCATASATQAFARCRVCGDPISEPRHRNCANLDCNLLYM
jgi:predicted sulfurtransferase